MLKALEIIAGIGTALHIMNAAPKQYRRFQRWRWSVIHKAIQELKELVVQNRIALDAAMERHTKYTRKLSIFLRMNIAVIFILWIAYVLYPWWVGPTLKGQARAEGGADISVFGRVFRLVGVVSEQNNNV